MGPIFETCTIPVFLLTRTSRKAKDPLCFVSIVNWMDGLTEFICWRKLLMVFFPCGHTMKVSST